MRFCIVGAGAIGGFVGAKLALAGEEVTFIARGKNLAAINEKGMSVFYRDGREEHATMARAEEDYAKAGTFDVVILTHRAREGAVRRALATLHGDYLVGAPRVLRIEEP